MSLLAGFSPFTGRGEKVLQSLSHSPEDLAFPVGSLDPGTAQPLHPQRGEGCAVGRAELQEDHIQNRNIKHRNSFWSAEYLSHLKGLSTSQKPSFPEESCACV